jgi:hypothetical protein
MSKCFVVFGGCQQKTTPNEKDLEKKKKKKKAQKYILIIALAAL